MGPDRGMGAALRWARAVSLVMAVMVMAACTTPVDHNADANLTRSDFERLNDPAPGSEPLFAEEAPLPELYPVLAAPAPPPLSRNPPVTIQVTDEIPLKDVLFELARQAGVDIELDPRIAGGVMFSARERPFLSVIERISTLAGLRWTAADDSVRITLDEPFVETYRIPQLLVQRNIESETSISTSLVDAEGEENQDTASEFTITGDTESNFFEDFIEGLTNIVDGSRPAGLQTSGGAETQVIVNRQAGVISILGTSRQHQAAQRFIDQVNEALAAQVLIEARVIEVTLAEEFRRGIDWSAVLDKAGIGTFNLNLSPTTSAVELTSISGSEIGVSLDAEDGRAVLNLIENFGTVQTLSTPRLTVSNNQAALLKVAQNFVYFRLDVEFETATADTGAVTRTNPTFTSEIQTVPVGFVMNVQPAIDLANNQVMLTLRPTVTQIAGFVEDPAIELNDTQNQIQDVPRIPIIDIREIDSVLRLRSGEVAVLGGLMQNRVRIAEEGVPGTGNLPVISVLANARDRQSELVELVILLRATILSDNPMITAQDRRLYRDFTSDPRPLSF